MKTTHDLQMARYSQPYEDPSLTAERERNSVAAIVELLKQLMNPALTELTLDAAQLAIIRKLLSGNI